MTRTELIAALEAQEGPSRELDMAIELLLEDAGFDEPAANWPEDCPPYTSSIDAALSFTPEGWKFHQFGEYQGLWRANLFTTPPAIAPTTAWARAMAATPAIAICIANFRALEAQEKA